MPLFTAAELAELRLIDKGIEHSFTGCTEEEFEASERLDLIARLDAIDKSLPAEKYQKARYRILKAEQIRVRNRAWYYDNQEEILARQRETYWEDVEKSREYKRNYYKKNKKKILKQQKGYARKRKGKKNEKN